MLKPVIIKERNNDRFEEIFELWFKKAITEKMRELSELLENSLSNTSIDPFVGPQGRVVALFMLYLMLELFEKQADGRNTNSNNLSLTDIIGIKMLIANPTNDLVKPLKDNISLNTIDLERLQRKNESLDFKLKMSEEKLLDIQSSLQEIKRALLRNR